MSVDLRGRHFLKLLDFTPEEALHLLDLSAELKEAKRSGTEEHRLTGKNLALIFEKGSTRTRCAFEVAASPNWAWSRASPTVMEPNASRGVWRRFRRIIRRTRVPRPLDPTGLVGEGEELGGGNTK